MTDHDRKRLSVNFNFSFHVTFHPNAKLKKKNEITKLVSCLTSSKRKKKGSKRKTWVEAAVGKFAGNSCLPKAQL